MSTLTKKYATRDSCNLTTQLTLAEGSRGGLEFTLAMDVTPTGWLKCNGVAGQANALI